MFSKNLLKSTLSKKQKTITNKQQNSMCLCGSKKIIKINPFKKTKKHNQQTAKLYVPMWFKKTLTHI